MKHTLLSYLAGPRAALALIGLSCFVAVVHRAQQYQPWTAASVSDHGLDNAHHYVAHTPNDPDLASVLQGIVQVSSRVDGEDNATRLKDDTSFGFFRFANLYSSKGRDLIWRSLWPAATHVWQKATHTPILMLEARVHSGTQNGAHIVLVTIFLVVVSVLICVVLGGNRRVVGRENSRETYRDTTDWSKSYDKLISNSPSSRHSLQPSSSSSVSGTAAAAAAAQSHGQLSAAPLASGTSPLQSRVGLSPFSPSPIATFPTSATQPALQTAYPPTASDIFASQSSLLPPPGRLPPPLCPNVVLPNCEVRVGVPMHELGKINHEGELSVVGLSGNPLLRANLRKTEAGRLLEISMPDPRSAPRAVVGPSIQDVVRPDRTRSRAVRICGMKDLFYGILEMRSTGACYVIKDGQTVLIIDGDSESLQLAIKSGDGVPLAAVTCSSEPFGGSEHLEIRVQPGVDTVLVLACVLSVVLLSPYPASD